MIGSVVVIGSVIGSVLVLLSSLSGSLLTAPVVVVGTPGGFVVVELLVLVLVVLVVLVVVLLGVDVVVSVGFGGIIYKKI